MMDLQTRQLLDEAIALDDKARAEYACWEAKQAERKRAQAQTHSVYKTYEPKVAAQQQPPVSAEWVQARLENLASIIGAEVGRTQTEIVKKLREEMRAEIDLLRAEIADLRQQKTGVVSLQHRRAS